jgi:hypothetical protein
VSPVSVRIADCDAPTPLFLTFALPLFESFLFASSLLIMDDEFGDARNITGVIHRLDDRVVASRE